MDIGSKKAWPSSALSNFHPRQFIFDGVECASMEGLLQSLKTDKAHIQVEICKLVGLAAKRRGQKRNKAWKSKQTLWWKERPMGRNSQEYQDFLDRAFNALAENEKFKKALLATGNAKLTHKIGKSKKAETCLTEREFCSRLEKIRTRLQKQQQQT